jgi:phytoene desaturase
MRVAIIGAGVAGLAAAVRMASRGFQVDVFEANEYPGGKLSEFRLQGYRFDAGPSLFTMPQYVEALFQIADVPMSGRFAYRRLPVVCRYFWEDGTRLLAHAEPQAFAQEVENTLGAPAETLLAHLRDCREKHESTGWIFLEKSLHRFNTWWSRDVAKALLKIPSLGLFSTMNRVHERHLKHEKLVQLFNRFATYNGSDPYRAPGLLSVIPHFEHHIGAFFPEGGMHAITQAIYELARDKGARFHFNTPVRKILVRDGAAWGVETQNGVKPYDRIISNIDVYPTYRRLMPEQRAPKRTLRQERSTSALIFYWGIRQSFSQLGLHNIIFSEDYRAEFAHLGAGEIFADPTVYVNITSKYARKDAPPGSENWFTMINAPYNAGQNWDAIIAEARENVIAKLNRTLGLDLRPLIACEAILDPRDIERKTASHLGALYGAASNRPMAAFLRHPNYSRRIRHLYFCGGSAHPGGGIPLCLLSAKIVDELLH